ncbi:MAG: TnpV protein [Clostridia bacterium]|nr:TnpV protein [Clostridia bacterium]
MKPYIKDERTGLAYELVGDYYLPAGEDDLPPLGIWGRHRLAYLKSHRRDLYADLLLSGKLEGHLSEIDTDASEMASRLTAQLARTEGVTEALKSADPMAWVGRMNSIRNRVMEIVTHELIYT